MIEKIFVYNALRRVTKEVKTFNCLFLLFLNPNSRKIEVFVDELSSEPYDRKLYEKQQKQEAIMNKYPLLVGLILLVSQQVIAGPPLRPTSQ